MKRRSRRKSTAEKVQDKIKLKGSGCDCAKALGISRGALQEKLHHNLFTVGEINKLREAGYL